MGTVSLRILEKGRRGYALFLVVMIVFFGGHSMGAQVARAASVHTETHASAKSGGNSGDPDSVSTGDATATSRSSVTVMNSDGKTTIETHAATSANGEESAIDLRTDGTTDIDLKKEETHDGNTATSEIQVSPAASETPSMANMADEQKMSFFQRTYLRLKEGVEHVEKKLQSIFHFWRT